jgi:hypothetical protein
MTQTIRPQICSVDGLSIRYAEGELATVRKAATPSPISGQIESLATRGTRGAAKRSARTRWARRASLEAT